jgi:hypothetical protein
MEDRIMTNPDNNPLYFVTDDNGQPIGVFDVDVITTEGTKLAFAMAAVCDDKDALLRVQQDTLNRVGPDSFGYIVGNALAVMAEYILGPTFKVTRAYGNDLQAGMAAIARGEQP